MNLQIIHSDFQLNLVDTSFTMVEENNWFSDKLFSKYTYTISKTLTDEEDAAFRFITQNSSRNVQTIMDVRFCVLDMEHEAVMEIEKIKGRKIEFQIRYGFEEFPNFEKKLSQLPLHKFPLVGETIFQHAAAKIAFSYPATDYNFPRIFTDQFDKESPQWQAFEGSVNNYDGSAFLENEYDVVEDMQLNRNIMQPLPSLLYVLKTGFADKGYTLAGDILEDPEFKEAWLYSLSQFYSTIAPDGKQEMLVKTDEHIEYIDGFGRYERELEITEPGRYAVKGNLFIRSEGTHSFQAFGKIFYKGQQVAFAQVEQGEYFLMVDLVLELFPGQGPEMLQFQSVQLPYQHSGGGIIYDATILDITISQLTKYNPDGTATPTLVLPNEIDLTQCVPDITFGELYKAVKLWKNYSISITGDTVKIDLVKNLIGRGTPIDLSHKEVREPERTFNQGKTFELKFTEIDSDVYKYPSVYVNSNGVTQTPYVPKEGTEEIIIDAVPLPLKSEDGVVTAHGFIDDNQKLQLVLYAGLTSGMNIAKDTSQLYIQAIYQNYYKDWIDFLLKTQGYIWTFSDVEINVRDLNVYSTIYAYGIYHAVVSLRKKNTGTDDNIDMEIETYSLE